jgi:hypothetical protein
MFWGQVMAQGFSTSCEIKARKIGKWRVSFHGEMR